MYLKFTATLIIALGASPFSVARPIKTPVTDDLSVDCPLQREGSTSLQGVNVIVYGGNVSFDMNKNNNDLDRMPEQGQDRFTHTAQSLVDSISDPSVVCPSDISCVEPNSVSLSDSRTMSSTMENLSASAHPVSQVTPTSSSMSAEKTTDATEEERLPGDPVP